MSTASAYTDSASALAAAGVRAVLFDVDGTLYSQRGLRLFMAGELLRAGVKRPRQAAANARIITAFRRTREHLRAHGRAVHALEVLQFEETADRLGLEIDDVRRVIDDWMFTRPLRYLPLVRRRGLVDLLQALDGQVAIGALSDYPPDAKLDALGVGRHFSLRLCATDRSINAFKPHPRGFLAACERWSLHPQEVLYVGDRHEVDAAGAAAAGTRCVIVGGRRPRDGALGAAATIRCFADLAAGVFAR